MSYGNETPPDPKPPDVQQPDIEPPDPKPLDPKAFDWRKRLFWIWENTDSLTKWVQVAALIIAGYWAYTRFVQVDRPSLEPTGSLDIKVDQYESDGCRVRMEITLKNIGHTPFDIDTLRLNAWKSQPEHPSGETPTYLSLTQIQKGEHLLQDMVPEDLILNQHFPPGSAASQDFTFEFKQLHGRYLIEATAQAKQGKLNFTGTNWSEWSCPNPTQESAPRGAHTGTH